MFRYLCIASGFTANTLSIIICFIMGWVCFAVLGMLGLELTGLHPFTFGDDRQKYLLEGILMSISGTFGGIWLVKALNLPKLYAAVLAENPPPAPKPPKYDEKVVFLAEKRKNKAK